MKRKNYSKEFKVKADVLMNSSSKSIRQLSEEPGVAEHNLYNWRKQLQGKTDTAFSNQPRFDGKELELRNLRARIAELEEELDILKKAAVFSESRTLVYLAPEEGRRSTR